MPPPPFKHRRCNYFDKNGRPIGSGCSRGSTKCRFVHPNEPEWDMLPPVGPPPSHATHKRPSDFHEPPRSPNHNKHQPSNLTSSPPLIHRISTRHAHGHSRSPNRSPSGFVPRQSPSLIPRSPASPTSSRFRPNRKDSSSSVANKEAETLRGRRDRTDSVGSSKHSHNIKGDGVMGGQSATRMPGASRRTSVNMQGAPTITKPSLSSIQDSVPSLPSLPASPVILLARQPRAELPTEQKRKIWTELVRLMSEALQQRSKLVKIDADINLINRVAFLTPTGPVPDSTQVSFEAKRVELEKQREEEMKNYEALFNRLIAAENWPATPPIDSNDREAWSKTIKRCEELLHKAYEIRSAFSSDTYVGDPSRPLKRRRVEGEGQEEKQQPQAVANSEAYEELRDRVLSMHETMSSIQNYQTTIRNDLVVEYKEYTDTKIEEATTEVAKNNQDVKEKFTALKSNFKSTGDDVGELAGEVEKLILDNGSLRAEIGITHDRITDTVARVNQLEQRLQDLTNGRNQFTKAIEALKAAHAAHMAKPMSPPISPSIPPIDYIVQMVQDPLLDAARSAIKPLLVDTKEEIRGLLKGHTAEMRQTLWNDLVRTLKLVDVLSERLASTNNLE